MDVELTKSAKKSIAKIYKEYLRRVKSGESKAQAAFFDNGNEEQAELISYISDDSRELRSAGLIKETITGCIELQNSAIVYMENLTQDTINEWLSFVANFLP